MGMKSAANASDKIQDIKGVHLGARSKQPALQNDKGNTTLGAIPPNVDRGGTRAVPRHIGRRDLFGKVHDPQAAKKGLKREFIMSPFSVLDARAGDWQHRKRAWLGLGIRSELGRGEHVGCMETPTKLSKNEDGSYARVGKSAPDHNPTKTRSIDLGIDAASIFFDKGNARQTAAERGLCNDADTWVADDNKGSGVSIFDPVICELMYRWFCPPGGQVLDPFAGGSVRGVVASCLDRRYFGCDLSTAQIEANRLQGATICAGNAHPPVWHNGDSTKIRNHVPDGFEADFVFSCPPYADLEVYSSHPADISNMPYEEFRDAYAKIIRKSCSLLKPNAFAAFVIGEVRDTRKKHAPYYDFVGDTKRAFVDAGLDYYNEMILVTCIGSLPLRTKRAFHATRKVGKTHQNLLIFCKGDPRKAAEANPLGTMTETGGSL